jgi:pyrrolysine biosynthesis protein PylC
LIVGIVGGKLQGVEAAYLARKAEWRVRLVDRNARVPAAELCHTFRQADATVEKDLGRALGDVDLVIPALEDDRALRSLVRWTRKSGVPLAFDSAAYAMTASKLESAQLFQKVGLPIPEPWPNCGFPVLAKPVTGSGSKGVRVFQDLASLQDCFGPDLPPPDWILEALVDGSQHSLEVIGRPGNYRLLQVTDLYVDQDFDCKRVIAPSNLPPNRIAEFERLSLTIAEALNLHGIMDVEAIHSGEKFKVLEIDARLPSQTPTAVYWSTRCNMVRLLGDLYGPPQTEPPVSEKALRGVVYEHIHVDGDILKVCGEGIMTQGGPLTLQDDFFGAEPTMNPVEIPGWRP